MTGNLVSMGDQKVSRIFFIQLLLVILSIGTIFFAQKDFGARNNSKARLAVSGEVLSHIILGYKFPAADALWLRVIQDIDYKENAKVSKGWVFTVMDAITTLDPRYAMVYRQGVVVLSIVIRDALGAQILYERGVTNLPHNWEIAYKAGFHYLHELKQCKRAAELFNQAADNGAPYWVHGLAGRLYAKAGQYEIAKSVLEDGLKNATNDKYKKEFQERLDQLEAQFRDPNNKTLIKGLECPGQP